MLIIYILFNNYDFIIKLLRERLFMNLRKFILKLFIKGVLVFWVLWNCILNNWFLYFFLGMIYVYRLNNLKDKKEKNNFSIKLFLEFFFWIL